MSTAINMHDLTGNEIHPSVPRAASRQDTADAHNNHHQSQAPTVTGYAPLRSCNLDILDEATRRTMRRHHIALVIGRPCYGMTGTMWLRFCHDIRDEYRWLILHQTLTGKSQPPKIPSARR